MKKKIGVILTLILFSTSIVLAHPGRTDSNGCHTCKTNCEKYGLNYGEYHCHDGSSSSSSSKKTTTSSSSSSSKKTTSSSSSTSTKTTTVKKSSDTSLKTIKVDGKTIDIAGNLEYTTEEESVIILAIATDKNAKLDYDEEVKLEIGENEIDIKVTAEDGTTKTYTITVIHEEEEVVPVISGNVVENKEANDKDVQEDDDVTFGDVVVTAGVCGLGYLGYKKYKENKKNTGV